jgi:hypothetical protein
MAQLCISEHYRDILLKDTTTFSQLHGISSQVARLAATSTSPSSPQFLPIIGQGQTGGGWAARLVCVPGCNCRSFYATYKFPGSLLCR